MLRNLTLDVAFVELRTGTSHFLAAPVKRFTAVSRGCDEDHGGGGQTLPSSARASKPSCPRNGPERHPVLWFGRPGDHATARRGPKPAWGRSDLRVLGQPGSG